MYSKEQHKLAMACYDAAPDLLEALEALSSLEVRGRPLIARLQFSTEGRALATKITNAINKAKGE